jgi:hypothetical protein
LAVPVELHVQIGDPLPDDVEVAAYYVVAEALTNAAKHARASVVDMDVTTDDETLTLKVQDDGVGGADPGGGSGLVGLQDRVEALGGTITVDSTTGSGTLCRRHPPDRDGAGSGDRRIPPLAARARVTHESGLSSAEPAAQHRPRPAQRGPTHPHPLAAIRISG